MIGGCMWNIELAAGGEAYSNLLRDRPDLFLKIWAVFCPLIFVGGAYNHFKSLARATTIEEMRPMKTKIAWTIAGALGLVAAYFSFNEIMSVVPKNPRVVGEKVLGQTPKETGRDVPTSRTLEDLRAPAEKGDAKAQSILGLMYANGQGVAKDSAEAVKWYRKAAEQGRATAQNNLGLMYEKGEGVAKDHREAVKWYRLAAQQGYATAQGNLAAMYANGQGVAKDAIEGLAWTNIAAASGDENFAMNRSRAERQLGPQATLAAQQRSKEILKEIEAAKKR